MKKVAVGIVKSFLKENATEDSVIVSLPVGDNTFEMKIRTRLTTDEKSAFIHRVLNGCFDADNNFRPEYVLPVVRATILQMCTNLPPITISGEVDEDGGSVLDLDAMDRLFLEIRKKGIDNDDFWTMVDDIVIHCNDAINWKKERVLHSADSAFSDLIVYIKSVVESLSEEFKGVDIKATVRQIGELSKATSGIGEGDILKGLLAMQKDKQ